ncbi:hypothetical protein DPMN_077680 [Dreissena polymorpha]|uniref:Uncharacterized protein n=1 Tax=Dreissena polymorpha TaxID=45954 RepID=A0A9D3YPT3_DREPO|nr:hypothetical protein DPMN_077680 [Dreissena polymorpha]
MLKRRRTQAASMVHVAPAPAFQVSLPAAFQVPPPAKIRSRSLLGCCPGPLAVKVSPVASVQVPTPYAVKVPPYAEIQVPHSTAVQVPPTAEIQVSAAAAV